MEAGRDTDVVVEQDGAVLVVRLNRPHAMNSIDSSVVEGLRAAFSRLDSDRGLRSAVLTGTNTCFSAGMDLKAFQREGAPPHIEELFRGVASKPVIAAVEGVALAGGLELALACDLIVSGRGGRFGIPEVRVGLFAGGGGLLRLPRMLPYGVAVQMALTGDPLSADRAHACGLVAELTEPGAALGVALQLAHRIAQNSPRGVAASKAVMRHAVGASDDDFWAWQRPYLEAALRSPDAMEGVAAFSERRSPVWPSI
jgi:enoyl-CoA hydratase